MVDFHIIVADPLSPITEVIIVKTKCSTAHVHMCVRARTQGLTVFGCLKIGQKLWD